jgi:hypothetical protein
MIREMPPNSDNRKSGKVRYTAEAEEARENPGVWFVFRVWPKNHSKRDDATARTISGNLRHGKFAAFRPAGAFDSVSRKTEDGKLKVYIMWLGKAVEDEINEKIRKAAK